MRTCCKFCLQQRDTAEYSLCEPSVDQSSVGVTGAFEFFWELLCCCVGVYSV